MTRNLGKEFEQLTKIFFSNLFQKIGFIVNKERIQLNGTQDGFDILFVISENYTERNIFIECKDYSTDLKFGNIYSKAHDLEANYEFSENDIAFFISPRANFGNSRNSEKSEPIFNKGKFPFEIRLLEKNNGIEYLFATDKAIYKKIYKKDCLINVDNEIEYSKFKSILLSRGSLKKIQINEHDRQKYIINIQTLEPYIDRQLLLQEKFNQQKKKINSLNQVLSELNLIDATKNILNENAKDGIILLGNPGSGKSIELQNLAIHFWRKREVYNWVPFYRPINTFINTSEIVDFLPKNWENIPYLLIVLDGLDEISYSLEFKTKLDKFLTDNTKTKIKFVLSCRTNVYENTIKSIKEFDCFVLKDIVYYQSIEFLQKKYNLNSNDLFELSFNSNQKEFLETPYYLNLFGKYYQETSKLPTNKVQLIEKYVEKRLEDDRKSKYKNKPFDKSIIKLICKKVALSMVAMQVSKISSTKIYSLLKNEKELFTNSCFVEVIFGKDEWKFEHKNVQEYFVASALNDLETEQIIDFIKLDREHNKTHPSWLNSISHLINLMNPDAKKYEEIINWLIENDSEILFKADKNRVSNQIKTSVFQKYFNKKCKDDTLWIRKYDAEVRDISRFADCNDNIKYLLNEFKNKKNHRRTRISALDLISTMSYNSQKNEIKETLMVSINEPIENDDFSFNSFLIDSFTELNFYRNNKNNVDSIIKTYENLDHLEITNSILKLIEKVECNNYLKYIIKTAPKTIDNSKRVYQRDGNLSTGETHTLKNVLKKLSNFKGCIFELNFYLKNDHQLNTSKEDIERIIQKIIQLDSNDSSIFKELINFCVKNHDILYSYEDLISLVFLKTENRKKAFLDIYNLSEKFDNIRSLLTQLVTKEEFNFILNEFANNKIDEKDLLYFRNNLSYVNFDLSLEFQMIVVSKTNYKFNNDFLKKEIRNKWQNFHQTKAQKEFNLLFKKEKLEELSEQYFKRFEDRKLHRDNQLDERKEYYKSIKLQKKFPQNFIHLIHNSFTGIKKTVSLGEVKNKISSEFYLISSIKRIIENDKNSNIKISQVQIQTISDWSFDNINKVDFKDYPDYNNRTNSKRCELLLFFRERFELKYPKKILLDITEAKNERNYFDSNEESIFDSIVNEVGKEEVIKRILDNFDKGMTNQIVFKNHCYFAIENDLKSVFNKIEDYITNEQISESLRSNVLKPYFEKTNNINLLKRLTNFKFDNDYTDLLPWTSLKLLIDNNELDFTIKKLLENLNLNLTNRSKIENIKFLVRCNYKDAFKLFNEWLKNNITEYNREINYSISDKDWDKHTNTKSIENVVELIEISCNPNFKFDTFSNPIRIARETLKNITQKNNPEVCLEVIKMMEKSKSLVNDESFDYYHFNSIIEETWKDFYNHKSKPMNFKTISKKIEELKYDIL